GTQPPEQFGPHYMVRRQLRPRPPDAARDSFTTRPPDREEQQDQAGPDDDYRDDHPVGGPQPRLGCVRIESAGGIEGAGYRYARCYRAPCVYWIDTLVVGPSHGRILSGTRWSPNLSGPGSGEVSRC